MRKFVLGTFYGMILTGIIIATFKIGMSVLGTFPRRHYFPNVKNNAVGIEAWYDGNIAYRTLIPNEDGYLVDHYAEVFIDKPDTYYLQRQREQSEN